MKKHNKNHIACFYLLNETYVCINYNLIRNHIQKYLKHFKRQSITHLLEDLSILNNFIPQNCNAIPIICQK